MLYLFSQTLIEFLFCRTLSEGEVMARMTGTPPFIERPQVPDHFQDQQFQNQIQFQNQNQLHTQNHLQGQNLDRFQTSSRLNRSLDRQHDMSR